MKSLLRFVSLGLALVSSFVVRAEAEGAGEVGAAAADLALFADPLCQAVKENVTAAQVAQMQNPLLRGMAEAMQKGTYDRRRFLVASPYPLVEETARALKTSAYSQFENPTGIHFQPGETVVIFVGDTQGQELDLRIQDFAGKGERGRFYPLNPGLNVFKSKRSGLAYVSYYTPAWRTAPPVKLHLASGTVNGLFDVAKNTDEDWKRLLASASYGAIDLCGERVHLVFSLAAMRQHCPEKGLELLRGYDEIIRIEQELMGLDKYGERPKNHMFGRTVWNGYMFADGTGAGFNENTLGDIGNADRLRDNAWGIAHEFGHVNQIRPDMMWVSTTEVTNNIYSSWVNYRLNPGDMRLEHERIDGGDGNGPVAGGRFNAFLNAALVAHENWLCQRGPDKMAGYEDGGDHFVKLVPLWQLQLYFGVAGRGNPDFYPDLFRLARQAQGAGRGNGQLQLQFMRNACDVAQQDLTGFFEAAGLLKPIDRNLDDYTRGQLTITAADCQALKEYAKKYPRPDSPVIYYISANSVQAYKDRLPVAGMAGQGVKPGRHPNQMAVDHGAWKNAVAFETYQGEALVRATMAGTGSRENRETLVPYPPGATRIEAVAWDGQRSLVYGQRP